jgi:hypothetical protein
MPAGLCYGGHLPILFATRFLFMHPKLLRRATLLAFVPLAFGLSSCSEEPAGSGLLAHVPADSPYVFTASEPLPEPLYSRLMAMSALQLQDAQRDWHELTERMAELRAEQQREQGGELQTMPVEGDTFRKVVEALIAELDGKLSAEGMETLGFGRDSDSVLYGLSLFPVLRAEVVDPARVEAFLARIEQRSGSQAPIVEYEGQRYRRIPVGEQLALIIALREQQLVMGMLPVAGEGELLALLLGSERPANALADAALLTELQERYGYKGYGEGYVDLRAVSQLLTGQRGGKLDGHWYALAKDAPRPSPGCQGLVGEVVAGVPRVVAGITDVQRDGYALTAAYETAPAVSAQLQRLVHARPLPGMGADGDALFSMGMDIDIPALRESLKTLLRYLAEQGGRCEWIEPGRLQAAMPQLDLMLGPMLGGLSGMYFELGELRVDPQHPQGGDASGGMLLAVSDPQGALAMAAMMNPPLAQLQLTLDGEPVSVPTELLPPGVPAMHLAAREGLLAVAVGEDSARRAAALLTAPRGDTPMLLGMNYDMARFMGLMEQMMGLMAERLESAGELEQAQELRAQAAGFAASAGQGGRMQLSLAPDARGLVIRQQVQLD